MGKYIDADKLRVEVGRLYNQNVCDYDNGCNEDQCYGYDIALSDLRRIINSLQQDHLPDAGKMVEQDHIADVSKMVEPEHIADVSKMMKDAVEVSAEVGYFNQRGLSILLDKSCEKLGLEEGRKYKLIIKEIVMYSLLEKHNDGMWWYHPGFTFDSPKEAEDAFKEAFWWDLSRPHKVFEHRKPLFQEYSTCTRDFKTFEFGGIVMWEE